MTKWMRRLGVLFILALCATLLACDELPSAIPPSPTTSASTTTTSTPVTGIVELRATDAPPSGITNIIVTTDNIQVHKAGAEEQSWTTVVDEKRTFDLVAIQGMEVFWGQHELEAGKYTEIRLDVTEVKVVIHGEEVAAELPGDKLRIMWPWEIRENEKTILTLDFDADKFVVVTGNTAEVRPVIGLEVSQGDRPLKTRSPAPTPTPSPTPSPSPIPTHIPTPTPSLTPTHKSTPTPTPTPTTEPMVLSSTAFDRLEFMPVKYTCSDRNISPPLAWSGVPSGTRSLVLIMDDTYTPWVFTHWVLFNIPADVRELPEGLSNQEQLANGALQGENGYGEVGYRGPCPEPGPAHRYLFTIYAVDKVLELEAGASRKQVVDEINGRILTEAKLIGTYWIFKGPNT